MNIKVLIKSTLFFFALIIAGALIYLTTADKCLLEDCKIVKQNSVTKVRFSNGASLNAEIAGTSELREKGLMYRTELEQDWGMLFIFDRQEDWSIWMKNTYIPLDLLFVNIDKEIVYIIEDVQPCKTSSCESYTAGIESLYIIETNSGWVKQNNILVGQNIEILK